jgi:hypothetical protein
MLFLALLLAVVLVLGACTGSGTNDSGSNDGVIATETPVGGTGDTGGTEGEMITPEATAETQ